MQPDFEAVEVPFDQILEAVTESRADAGLVIHEAQLTYSKSGFHQVVDLGRWWKNKYDLPLPLGANVLRRDLSPEIGTECCRMMRESIQYALDHRDEALLYALQFARDMDPSLAEKFVGMYVNHYTVDCGELVPKAAQKLLDLGHEAGIIPHRVSLEFNPVKTKLFVTFLLAGFSLTCPFAIAQDAPATSGDPKQRVKSVRDLVKQGQDSIPRIAPYVRDPDTGVRVEAVKGLIELGGPRTVEPLVAAAGDNDPEVQIRATDGLVNAYLPAMSRPG